MSDAAVPSYAEIVKASMLPWAFAAAFHRSFSPVAK